jgi:predicted GIY-YIG superfamily endonuclease
MGLPFWVYMLRCNDGSFYIGHTDDLEPRLARHHSGVGSRYTARRLPLELVWCECFAARAEAIATERQIKGWCRRKKLALIAGDWQRVRELSRSRSRRPGASK